MTREQSIWRTPVTDGNELKVKEELVIGPPYHPTTDWTLAGNEVVFFDRGDESHAPAFRAYHTVTAQVRTIVDVDKGNYPAISADGRILLYSALDRSGANIMVAKLSR